MPPSDFLGHLRRALNFRRADEADIWTNYTVVRPYDSRGLTVVRSQCNEQEIVVGNVSGLTFAPGASVMIGTNTNRPGKAIIAGAPPGRMGASRVPPEISRTTYGTAPVVASSCPAAIMGKSYLGIYVSGTELRAWRYTDGTWIELLGVYDYSADGWSSLGNFQRVNSETEAVVFYARKGGSDWIISWDIDGGVVYQLDTGSDHIGGPVWVEGTDVYFCNNSSDLDGVHLTLHKVALYATGTVDLGATQQGTELLDATGFLSPVDGILLWSAGPKFQLPCFWLDAGTEVVIPYWQAGAWNLGAGRATIAGPEDTGTAGCGYATASGGLSARVSYTTLGAANVGLMPTGPATPETAMLPADWEIISIENLSMNAAGFQMALFPVTVSGEGDSQDKLLRLPVTPAGIPSGCPLNRITVEAGPEGLPAVMLCRD